MESFFRSSNFLIALKLGTEKLQFLTELPTGKQLSTKVLLIVKAISKTKDDPDRSEITAESIKKDIIIMEVNKNILENLHLLCSVSNCSSEEPPRRSV